MRLQIVLIITLYIHQYSAHKNCYSTDIEKSQQKYYALQTKSPNFEPNVNFEELSGCSPVRVWLLNRHGTRYPNKMTRNNYKTLEKVRLKFFFLLFKKLS